MPQRRKVITALHAERIAALFAAAEERQITDKQIAAAVHVTDPAVSHYRHLRRIPAERTLTAMEDFVLAGDRPEAAGVDPRITALFTAAAAQRITTDYLGAQVGVEPRTIIRWRVGLSRPTRSQLALLDDAVHGREPAAVGISRLVLGAMLAAGFTPSGIARLAVTTRTNACKWVRGHHPPSLDNLDRLLGVLDSRFAVNGVPVPRPSGPHLVTALFEVADREGVSGSALSRELGRDRSTISTWRHGRHVPVAGDLDDLIDALGVTVTLVPAPEGVA